MNQGSSAKSEGGAGAVTLEYHVSGMTCAACSAAVEKAVRRVPGVLSANVNLIMEKLTVEAPQDFDKEAISRAVEKAGYAAQPLAASSPAFDVLKTTSRPC